MSYPGHVILKDEISGTSRRCPKRPLLLRKNCGTSRQMCWRDLFSDHVLNADQVRSAVRYYQYALQDITWLILMASLSYVILPVWFPLYIAYKMQVTINMLSWWSHFIFRMVSWQSHSVYTTDNKETMNLRQFVCYFYSMLDFVME